MTVYGWNVPKQDRERNDPLVEIPAARSSNSEPQGRGEIPDRLQNNYALPRKEEAFLETASMISVHQGQKLETVFWMIYEFQK
jgi:hypothetical protein